MFSTALINFCYERLQWKMLWDSRYCCFHSQAPGQMCFMSSLVFACLHPPEVLIYGSNRSSLAGLQENALREYQRDWKTRTRMKLCSSSHKHAHHTDKIKVFTTANASQGAQQVGPVLSLRASSLGGCKGLLGKQTRQATTFVASKTHTSAVMSLSSDTLSLSPRLARAPWWCQRFAVARCHAVSPNVPGFGDQQRQPARTQETGTGGWDRGRSGSSLTVTYFNQNGWFFDYLLVIYDTTPLVADTPPLASCFN